MSTNPTPAPLVTLDPNNPTPGQLAGYDADYIASLPPVRLQFYGGRFGITTPALAPADALALGFKLANQGVKIDMLTDVMGGDPAEVALSRYRNNYQVFSYIGEPNPDWTTTRPGDSEPNVPPYNSTGHTGIVSLTAPAPYVPVTPPAPAITGLIGPNTGATTQELSLPGPNLQVWEPSIKTLRFEEGFPYTDNSGGPTNGLSVVWHIEGNTLMDKSYTPGEGVWLGGAA